MLQIARSIKPSRAIFTAFKITLVFAVIMSIGEAAQLPLTCEQDMFPLVFGGSNQEHITCVLHDKVNDHIVVVGNTTSSDFSGFDSSHGFVFALDQAGKVKWGKTFQNVVTTITGCHVNSINNLVMLGIGQKHPVILEVSLVAGEVRKLFSIDKQGA